MDTPTSPASGRNHVADANTATTLARQLLNRHTNDPQTPQPLEGGMANWVLATTRHVVRIARTPATAARMERENHIREHVDTPLGAPVLAFGSTPAWQLQPRLPGVPLWQLYNAINTKTCRQITRQIHQQLANVHTTPVDEQLRRQAAPFPLTPGGDYKYALPAQPQSASTLAAHTKARPGWSTQDLQALHTLTRRTCRQLQNRQQRLKTQAVLVHGDLWAPNVLVHSPADTGGWHVTLLDFEWMRIGLPHDELAALLFTAQHFDPQGFRLARQLADHNPQWTTPQAQADLTAAFDIELLLHLAHGNRTTRHRRQLHDTAAGHGLLQQLWQQAQLPT